LVGVRGFLSSPRRRRRSLTAFVVSLLVAGVTFSMVHWSNTSHVHYAHTRPGKPTILPAPVPADYGTAKREGVLRVAAQFVNTAVRRQRVDLSYDLATPALRSGYTRKTWATQDIPVQPYPLDSARYRLKGSFTDSVWLQVAVYPDRKHKSVPAAVFDLTLKPFREGKSRRWLVDSWAPAGYSGVPDGPLGSDRGPVANVEYKSVLSERWLLVPISAFALGLMLLAALGVRGWWRDSRALKRYRSHSL
jgi:hypothetical protein